MGPFSRYGHAESEVRPRHQGLDRQSVPGCSVAPFQRGNGDRIQGHLRGHQNGRVMRSVRCHGQQKLTLNGTHQTRLSSNGPFRVWHVRTKKSSGNDLWEKTSTTTTCSTSMPTLRIRGQRSTSTPSRQRIRYAIDSVARTRSLTPRSPKSRNAHNRTLTRTASITSTLRSSAS